MMMVMMMTMITIQVRIAGIVDFGTAGTLLAVVHTEIIMAIVTTLVLNYYSSSRR